MTVRLGCDPEGFLILGDEFISAAGNFPGTKQEPFKIDKGAIQVDGMAIEFNIDAADNEDEFEKNISTVLTQLNEITQKVDKDIRIAWTPVARFDKSIWDAAPSDAKVLGCDPDYNIHGEVNPNPMDILEGRTLRTAAGHIHIGWREGEHDPQDPKNFMDALYVSRHFHKSGVFAPKTADESTRLGYYGANGAFRSKSYGVELRTPSNLWVRKEQFRREMYRNVRRELKACTGL